MTEINDELFRKINRNVDTFVRHGCSTLTVLFDESKKEDNVYVRATGSNGSTIVWMIVYLMITYLVHGSLTDEQLNTIKKLYDDSCNAYMAGKFTAGDESGNTHLRFEQSHSNDYFLASTAGKKVLKSQYNLFERMSNSTLMGYSIVYCNMSTMNIELKCSLSNCLALTAISLGTIFEQAELSAGEVADFMKIYEEIFKEAKDGTLRYNLNHYGVANCSFDEPNF